MEHLTLQMPVEIISKVSVCFNEMLSLMTCYGNY